MVRLVRFNMILGCCLCFLLLFGVNDDAFGQIMFGQPDNTEVLEDIQQQIFSLRAEFKAQIQKAERERQAIYEIIQNKLAAVVDRGQLLDAEFTEDVKQLLSELEAYDSKLAALERALVMMEATMNHDLDTIEKQLETIKIQGIKKPVVVSQKPETPQSDSSSVEFAPGPLFRAAYRIYMDGEYDVAIAGFQKYLHDYPDTQLAGAAQYWVAEALMKLGEYEIAMQEYDRLIATYPRDDKVPDAYYGKGVALLKLERTTEARPYFKYVIEHFSNTIAAEKAQNQLDGLP